MAPIYHSGSLYARDDSATFYKHPLAMVFALIGICLIVLTPTTYLLWRSRGDYAGFMESIDNVDQRYPSSDALARMRASRAQRNLVLHDAGGLITQNHRMATLAADLRTVFRASGNATTVLCKSLWGKIVTSTAKMTGPRRLRHRHRRSQTGSSMELPVMRRPAWQKLASGVFTPSATLADLNHPAAGQTDNGRETHDGGGTQVGQASRTPDRVEAIRVHIQHPEPALTVGLAMC